MKITEQIVKEQLKEIPSLTDSKWLMYDVKGNELINTTVIWHFTDPNDVHDDPEVWHGHWNKMSEDTIRIDRVDVAPPHQKYQYKAVFAGSNVFVVSGSDETRNRILIAILQK